MSVIENFAALPVKEQIEFATALLKTINSEKIFTDDTTFEITGVEANDLTGGLEIEVSHANPIEVRREATWTCEDDDYADQDPGYEADYENYIFKDAKKSFKTLSANIEGYTVSLEVIDADAGKTVDIEVDNISHEDDGIGDYEHFGFRGHDSRPYIAVKGVITKECECSLAFSVEPADETAVEATEEN